MKNILYFMLFLWAIPITQAQVQIIQGSFPVLCPGGDFVTQNTDILITEGQSNSIRAVTCAPNGFISMSLPAYFNYDISSSFTVTLSAQHDIIVLNASFLTKQYAYVQVSIPTTLHIDTLRISGLRIKALPGAPASYDINSSSGACHLTYISPTSFIYATLSTQINNPDIQVNGLPPTVCDNNTSAYPILSTPSGGTLSGPGLSGQAFVPQLAGAGTHTLHYTRNVSGCSVSDSTQVVVYAAPEVTLTCSHPDLTLCQGQEVTITAHTSGAASRYLFLKNNNGIQGPNMLNTFTTAALADGDQLSVLVDNGNGTCQTTSAPLTFSVGQYPKSDFEWQNACGTNTVHFTDKSTLVNGSLSQWQWDVEQDAVVDYTQSNPVHTYTQAQSYYSRLTVTSDKGCTDDTLIRVFTLPGVQPSSESPYAVNFALSPEGWNYDNAGNPSWGWTTANNEILTGARKVWTTGASTPDLLYNDLEQSTLNSPCFDFTQLKKPMISMKIWCATQYQIAGTILEASEDGGTHWSIVGRVGLGQFWYDALSLSGTPGNNLYAGDPGWTGQYEGWRYAKIALDQFAGKPAVRFRLAFGSPAAGPDKHKGIALDSVWIGERSKLLLIEHFSTEATCQAGCPDAALANAYVKNNLYGLRKKDLAMIYYHTSFPAQDVYNSYNTTDPSARVIAYGVSTAPRSFLDGKYLSSNVYDGSPSAIDTLDIDKRALDQPPFRLDLSTEMSGTQIKVFAKATALQDYYLSNTLGRTLVLQTAIVEDTANGNAQVNFTLRKMLPDAAGRSFTKSSNNTSYTYGYLKGDSIKVAHTWVPNLSGSRKFGVVVFIQDHLTKEILQSAYVKGSGTFGSPVNGLPTLLDESNIFLSPNPAREQVRVVLPGQSHLAKAYTLTNLLGQEMKSAPIEEDQFQIDLSSVPSGVYILQILGVENQVIHKKIIKE